MSFQIYFILLFPLILHNNKHIHVTTLTKSCTPSHQSVRIMSILLHHRLALPQRSITLALPCILHSICPSANLVTSMPLSYTQQLKICGISVSWEFYSKCMRPAYSNICTHQCISSTLLRPQNKSVGSSCITLYTCIRCPGHCRQPSCRGWEERVSLQMGGRNPCRYLPHLEQGAENRVL